MKHPLLALDELCGALGIDTKARHVTSIVVRLDPASLPSVVITEVLDDAGICRVGEVLKKYKLVEDEDD